MAIHPGLPILPSYSLKELGLVDAAREASYDNLTALATSIFAVPVSLLSIVEPSRDRQYFKSLQGLPEPWAGRRQTPLSHSFCQHVVSSDSVLLVNNAPDNELVRDNGAVRDLNVMAYLGAPVHDPNLVPIGALCVIDTEPRQWSDDQVSRLRQLAACVDDAIRLRAALNAGEGMRREQREFTYAISHDLKSPTNTLSMLHSELADELEPMPEDVRGLLEKCVDATGRMGGLIEDVLSYTRTLETGTVFERIDMPSMMADILADLKEEISRSGATINVGDLPDVFGMKVQVRSLFRQLLGNAIKFRKPDVPPVIKVADVSRGEKGFFSISVKDNGIGIPRDRHERIFKMFQRLHRRDHFAGTGLGLTLCRRIADNHGGAIAVRSKPVRGSEFIVTLPGKAP